MKKLILLALLLAASVALPERQIRSYAALVPSPAPAIVRIDSRLDQVVPPDAMLEKIADGFAWAEGPVWNQKEEYLLFSDVPNNRIIKWKAGAGTSVSLQPSGYTGAQPFTGREPGSNGLTFDKEGRLVFCQHGDRRISRLEKDGTRTTLVDNYQGKRLNSPNDLISNRTVTCISPIHPLV